MMPRTLSAVAYEVQGELVGGDMEFEGVSIDSRKLDPGALFVAITGENFDGNDFVADAYSKGAAGAVVSRLTGVPLPQIHVSETRSAFGQFAHAWRKNFSLPVVAVTGSNGKTTVKELIASILGINHNVCVTRGNFNNDLGVPLTLMRLRKTHDVLVVELGANHAGEIDYLGKLVQPTVGVITNANAAHLEGFGSIAGVSAAKGELLDHLPNTGTAVINADDAHCIEWCDRSRSKEILTFGLSAQADCTISGEIVLEPDCSRFMMCLPSGVMIEVILPLVGRHNVQNALAASTAAYALGASEKDIQQGLKKSSAAKGRLNVLPISHGAKIIDDTYNANPDSVRAALIYLKGLAGNRIFVLGDMAELGKAGESLHREIGIFARDCCDALFSTGDLSRHAADAFGDHGQFFSEIAALQHAVERSLTEDTVILLKGSRAMELDRLVELIGNSQTDREIPAC
ncbi:MAG: UDP-N-acetylmuramoyl-tripeptide--D-alanyl-D-alanine ligase [Candidatus Rariloculaceae bacterium]